VAQAPGFAGVFNKMFLASFICLFIYAVLNIFIQIMQQAYRPGPPYIIAFY
jgi:hypothetical protein